MMETIQISINWWKDKQNVIQPYNEILFSKMKYYSAIKRNDVLTYVYYHRHESFFLILTQGYADWFQREREGGKEEGKEIEKEREKHWSVSHMQPNQGPNPQPKYVPWPGIKPATFWYTRQWMLQLIEPPRQGNMVESWKHYAK